MLLFTYIFMSFDGDLVRPAWERQPVHFCGSVTSELVLDKADIITMGNKQH